MRARRGCALAVAVALLCGACSRSEKGAASAPAQPSGPSETLAFRVRVENTTGRTLRSARVFLYAPVSDAAGQQAGQVSASLPHELLRDALGNQRVYLQLKDVAPGYSAEVAVQARVAFAPPPPAPQTESRARARRALPPERTRPEIAEAAKSLKRESDGDTARSTLARLDELAQQKSDPLSAGLDSPAGRVALAVALLRANGIPARAVLGVSVRDGKLVGDALSIWLEYPLDGAWRRELAPAPAADGERWVAMRVLRNPAELAGSDWSLERLFESGGLRVRLES
jgi:transglutaminase-like putative cysteine protease